MKSSRLFVLLCAVALSAVFLTACDDHSSPPPPPPAPMEPTHPNS